MSGSQRFLAATLAAAATACGLLIADFATDGPVVGRNAELAGWFAANASPRLTTVVHAVTWAGNWMALAALVVVAAVLLWMLRRPRGAAALCASALGAEILAAGLKFLFHEFVSRHGGVRLLVSGHAAGAAAVYGVLLYLAAERRSAAVRLAAALCFVLVITAIGFCRLYVGAHHISDVLVGATLGIAVAASALLLTAATRTTRGA